MMRALPTAYVYTGPGFTIEDIPKERAYAAVRLREQSLRVARHIQEGGHYAEAMERFGGLAKEEKRRDGGGMKTRRTGKWSVLRRWPEDDALTEFATGLAKKDAEEFARQMLAHHIKKYGSPSWAPTFYVARLGVVK